MISWHNFVQNKLQSKLLYRPPLSRATYLSATHLNIPNIDYYIYCLLIDGHLLHAASGGQFYPQVTKIMAEDGQ